MRKITEYFISQMFPFSNELHQVVCTYGAVRTSNFALVVSSFISYCVISYYHMESHIWQSCCL